MNEGGMVKHHMRLRTWMATGVVLLALVLVPWMGSRTLAQPKVQPGATHEGRYLFADLAEQVLPSVVTVYVKRDMRKEMDPQTLEKLKKYQRQFQDPLLKQLIPFDIPQPGSPDDEGGDQWITKGSGSGVIVSADGYILTNWHVVGNAKNKPEIRVVLSDNTELSGNDVKLIESSQLADLALLKINRSGLHPIAWGDSDKLRIGEWVAAVGSPLDLRMTVTQGIICAKHREIDAAAGMGGMLQTDAVINPGSSGGALVNLDGQLIGVNRLITTPFQGREAWSGYGFAIPSNEAKEFVDAVIKNGKVSYGYIGVSISNDFSDLAMLRESLGLPRDAKGALVMDITPGSPSALGGVQQGDLIVEADGKPITNYTDLVGYVARRPVGSTVKLTVLRPQENGKPRRVSCDVKIAERPDQEALDKMLQGKGTPQLTPKVQPQSALGVEVEPTREGGRAGLKVTQVRPGSPAARAGIQEGDVITRINNMAVRTADDINKALSSRKDQPHLIQFLHDGRPNMTAIKQFGKGDSSPSPDDQE